MFSRIAVKKLKFLLDKGLVPNDEVQLCDENGTVKAIIDKFGRVIWLGEEKKRGISTNG